VLLSAIGEITFDAPGLPWSVDAALSNENELTFTAPGPAWALTDSVLTAETSLEVSAAVVLWSVAAVEFVGVAETTFDAPGLIWSIDAVLSGENELTFNAPGAVWTTGSNSLVSGSELLFDAPALNFEVAAVDFTAISETTFEAPGLLWEVSATFAGENELVFTAPDAVWIAGDSSLDANVDLSFDAPSLSWIPAEFVWTAVGSLDVSAPALSWSAGGVALSGSQIGGPFSIRRHILVGTTEKPAVLAGTFLN
jgi:hypothetical protein